jgi:hypothetical protein
MYVLTYCPTCPGQIKLAGLPDLVRLCARTPTEYHSTERREGEVVTAITGLHCLGRKLKDTADVILRVCSCRAHPQQGDRYREQSML